MKRFVKNLFYIPRHEKPTDQNIARLLMPSVIGIIICMICLAGATWAWFSSDVQIKPQTIKAASFDVLVSISAAKGKRLSPAKKTAICWPPIQYIL